MWSVNIPYLIVVAILSTAATTSPGDKSQCQHACEVLDSEFPGRVYYDGADANFSIWDQKQLQTTYVCRTEPSSATEVSRVLQILVNTWCRFAVKCGGHSRYPDDSVSVSGVTIDLALINNTVVSDDRTTAIIGGGALTRQVYAALDPYGLAYVGGRVGQVGIGGFALGGGTSVLSGKHGWAVDNILEYEVVLANSTIVTVSEHQHPDLYYALRGGGNNFGIVTSFTVGVFPQGAVYTGSRSFGDNQTNRFLEEAEKIFTIQDSEDVNVGLEYRYAYSAQQGGFVMSSTQRYSEPVLDPPVFRGLNEIPALTNLAGGINSLANSTRFSGPLGQTRNVFASVTHYPSLELSKKVTEIFKTEWRTGNLMDVSPELITYSIPAGAIQRMKLRGGNALGLDVGGHLVINLLSLSWMNSTNDEVAYAFANRFIDSFHQEAKALNVLHPFIYINYANKGQDVFSGYGDENKKRLLSIQQAVDPRGIFTSSGLWRGFFKLH
ncbi:FAD-binding domain-containing protein [Nemania sp. FL0031]|nr:FAD-binding domain-containing protein [Nemania sp. FL0031]